MINLIIDLNNIAHRSLFVVGGYGSKSYSFDSQSEIDQLMRKMTIDIALIIRTINPGRVILAKDKSSWRKTISIEENDGYKSQRTKSSVINWTNVYNALDEFCAIMEQNGMILSIIDKAEADDIISLWSEYFSSEDKEHLVIVSGDEDVRQLVQSSLSHITVYNPFTQGKNSSKKLFVDNKFIEWINTSTEVSLFNMKDSLKDVDKQNFTKIINSEKTKLEVISGNSIVLRKMFCGDDGDDVPAIYTWLTKDGKGNDKEVRVTNSKFEKFLEIFKTAMSIENVTPEILIKNSEKVKEILETVLKISINTDMKNRLIRQAQLVYLNSDFYPQHIVKDFKTSLDFNLSKPKLNTYNANMADMLEGTRYVSNTRNESTIFKHIDNIRRNPLF